MIYGFFEMYLKTLAKTQYKSKNPFNQQGNYLLELLRNNSNVDNMDVLKLKEVSKLGDLKFISELNDSKFNESICISLN